MLSLSGDCKKELGFLFGRSLEAPLTDTEWVKIIKVLQKIINPHLNFFPF